MNGLIDDAAGGNSRGRPAQLYPDIHFHALVGGDAREIDVQNLKPQVIPLHFLDQGFFHLAFRLNIHDPDAMADCSAQIIFN